jgi:hypothetical protein
MAKKHQRSILTKHVNDSELSQDLLPQATTMIELKSLILAQIERWRHA